MTVHAVGNGLGNQHAGEVIIKGRDFLVGSTPPAEVIRGGWATYEFTIGDDSVIGEIPVPREWARATLINVWARFLINEAYAANNGNVKFRAAYTAVETDGTEAIGAGATGNLDSADTALPAVALSPQSVLLGTIPAADLAFGDTLGIVFSRIALTGGGNDPAAQEPGIISVRFAIAKDNLIPQRQ